MNIKDIAATLAILGSGTLVIGCGKRAATESPGGSEAAPADEADPMAEGKCSAEVTDPDPADADADVTDPDPG